MLKSKKFRPKTQIFRNAEYLPPSNSTNVTETHFSSLCCLWSVLGRTVRECVFLNMSYTFFKIPQMKVLMVMQPSDTVFENITLASKKRKGETVALNCMSMGKSDMVIKVSV